MVDYENDRKILILLSLKHNKTSKEEKRYKILKERYADNDQYIGILGDSLIDGGYIESHDEPIENSIKVNTRYEISETGIKALTNGRFVSEYEKAKVSKRLKVLSIVSTVMGIIGIVFGILSPIDRYTFINNDPIITPIEPPMKKDAKPMDIKPDTSIIRIDTANTSNHVSRYGLLDKKEYTRYDKIVTAIDPQSRIQQT